MCTKVQDSTVNYCPSQEPVKGKLLQDIASKYHLEIEIYTGGNAASFTRPDTKKCVMFGINNLGINSLEAEGCCRDRNLTYSILSKRNIAAVPPDINYEHNHSVPGKDGFIEVFDEIYKVIMLAGKSLLVFTENGTEVSLESNIKQLRPIPTLPRDFPWPPDRTTAVITLAEQATKALEIQFAMVVIGRFHKYRPDEGMGIHGSSIFKITKIYPDVTPVDLLTLKFMDWQKVSEIYEKIICERLGLTFVPTPTPPKKEEGKQPTAEAVNTAKNVES